MADSDGQKLQDCLTSLSDGLRMEITRTTNLESTLTTQQSRVTELEQHFADQNIGQFLRGNALEWYTQIITSNNPPIHWDVFHTLFLEQFSSPLRLAQLQQEWHKCVQRSDEFINDFLVRLHSLWSEHKPHEIERDLVRHLFTKTRPQLVPLIGVLSAPTLENFLTRAREAELIDFSRSKYASSTRSNPVHNTRSNIVCYKCNIPGHLASQCTRSQFPPYLHNSKNYSIYKIPHSSQLLQVNGTLGRYPTTFTIDTGSNLTVINEHAFHHINNRLKPLIPIKSSPISVRCANGQFLRTHNLFHLNISFSNKSFLHPVYVLPQLQHFCILDLDFLRKYNLYVGGNNDQILFPPESNISSISTPPTPPPYHDDPILHHPSNLSCYSLATVESHHLPSYHSIAIPVQPKKPFFEFSDTQIYSVSSLHENLLVANGLISPQKMLCIEISNFSHLSIDIHPNQKLAIMTLEDAHQLHSLEKIPHQPTTREMHIPDLSYSDLDENQKTQLTTLIAVIHMFLQNNQVVHM
ncbi:unnamed protein product [Rotaria magnacalcarata]|uniref:CCHC-type domain-containing protein n=1 Tax=Rotaria magnacalcarata TaxID=392030 RepID=A0A814TC94_9BILA|nr:unnamed protein product [Rotaria magnacalcarata]CAF1461280.1 unnamed protein product [Rotaria magnacalcarata]CAF4051202.1 unnamed protein product [Rotaria magnacalcarata]CAF4066429.1 unnamed protein product [Rotaria magnacalcarata]